MEFGQDEHHHVLQRWVWMPTLEAKNSNSDYQFICCREEWWHTALASLYSETALREP